MNPVFTDGLLHAYHVKQTKPKRKNVPGSVIIFMSSESVCFCVTEMKPFLLHLSLTPLGNSPSCLKSQHLTGTTWPAIH